MLNLLGVKAGDVTLGLCGFSLSALTRKKKADFRMFKFRTFFYLHVSGYCNDGKIKFSL